MNFDNNGWEFKLNTNDPNVFIIDVDIGYGKSPSFGINSQGIFANNLFVDSNGKGLYKRKSKTRTLTAYLVGDILRGNILINTLDNYLDTMEIVNGQNQSTHNMIVDKDGNIWVIEPGRGNIKNNINDSPYFVMTNFSLIDFNAGNEYNDNSFDRYKEVENNLRRIETLTVNNAFKILEKVKQDGEWQTDFSMVYSKNEKKNLLLL
jgi:penicillin V acylase-like amidase (Ntn superfamily)